MPKLDDLVIQDARIIFRNFSGREEQFNTEGDRNFCVLLEPDLAEKMRKDGWNIKELKVREEGDTPEAYVQVSLNYKKGRPPRAVLVTSKGRTELGADEVSMLDWAEIKQVDIMLNPYSWEVNGNTGIKAYLKAIFVTLNESVLDLKYADLNQIAKPEAAEPQLEKDV